jgi:CheY-like chemotaxis protein
MKPVQVLLAEDNEGDVFLVHEALRAHGLQYQMDVVKDGSEVDSYLQRLSEAPESLCPNIFLLDLNLPKTDGYDILNKFRSHPQCADVPVLVVTSSDAPKDRHRAELLGATGYFRKPSDLSEFLELGAVVSRLVNTG